MLFLCSETCWASEQIVQWLCKACEMPECFLLPVLIGDHFQFPNAEVFSDLGTEMNTGGQMEGHMLRGGSVGRSSFWVGRGKRK